MDRPISVVLVDDDDDIRVLLRVMFDSDRRFAIVGEAADGVAAIAAVAATQPDVVIVDLQLPVVDGLGVIDAARRDSPGSRIVVFSAFPDPFTLLDVLARGGHALLNKASAWSELVPTVLQVCDGPVEVAGPA